MLANFGDNEAKFCLSVLKKLRGAGISSELYPTSVKIKKQMTYANNKGIQFVIMAGENEIESGLLSVKDMLTGEQSDFRIDDLIEKLS